MGTWEFYDALGDRPRGELTPTMQGLAAFCELRPEVNSGGLNSDYLYRGGATAPVALEVLRSPLVEEWSNMLREAMRLFGPVYPEGQEDREGTLDELDLDDALEQFDRRFLEVEGSTTADSMLDAQVEP